MNRQQQGALGLLLALVMLLVLVAGLLGAAMDGVAR